MSMTRRRFLLITLAGAALAACGGTAAAPSGNPSTASSPKANGGAPRWGMTAGQETAWQQIEAAADKEGTLTYYGQGTLTPAQVPLFMDAFKKDYPNIKVDLVNAGSPADNQTRISTEQDAKTYVGDIADISARSGLLEAKRGYTQKFIPPAAQDPTVKWLADRIYGDGDVTNDHMTWHPLWINTKLVPPDQEPKTHMDITNPKWKGKVLWYVPWTEGGGWNEYYWSKKLYGMDWVNAMIAVDPAFQTGTAELMTPLARGEYAIVLGSPGSGVATQMIHNNEPIKALWLDDFTHGSPSGHIFLNNAPHPNAAKVLLNWWIADAGQRFQGEVVGQFPTRADIPLKEDWQKGVNDPKQHFNNADISDADGTAGQKEAASIFKK